MTKDEIIYLSGPITGLPDFAERFAAAKKRLQAAGYEKIINPAEVNKVADFLTWQAYMAIDLQLLRQSTAICLLPGWKLSKGAQEEYREALRQNMKIFYLEEFL